MSTAAKAHGMIGTTVEPDWAPLTMDDVCRVLRLYPALTAPQRILTVSPRPFSSASVVATANSNVFVKRYDHSVRDQAGLVEEHGFLQHLWNNGARVPRVLQTAEGETAIELSGWTYEVQQEAEGIDLYCDAHSWTPFRATAHAFTAGQTLARLHGAANGYSAPRRKPQLLVASFTIFAAEDPQAALQCYLDDRPVLSANSTVAALAQEALDLLTPFHKKMRLLLPSLAPLWTHNDLHASNLLWSDAGENAHPTATIDFGLADRTNAVHDIAHAVERNIIEWLVLVEDPAHPENVPVHLDHLHTFLDGYESIHPLSREEAAALAPMVALCHAEFALSEAEYFLGVLGSQHKAMLACDGWLVGHARWFHTSKGRQLLDSLSERASQRARVKCTL